MCKYQIVNKDNIPMCEGTKQLCTMCVIGNMNTYNELEKQNNKNKNNR